MCLRPLNITTRAIRLYDDGGQPYHIQVPCGSCAECSKLASDQYYLRAYYECRSTLDAGGFVYFDTLTYRDACLPRISDLVPQIESSLDFPRFDYTHTRLFFVRVRQYLKKHYGIDKDCFKYFLTSEYGTDPRHTHRPHYHILFFVRGKIKPLDFSSVVSKCWPYGRTDGLPYQSISYVQNHVFSSSVGLDSVRLSNTSLYVAKYVQKDAEFNKVVGVRISRIVDYLRTLRVPLSVCSSELKTTFLSKPSDVTLAPKSSDLKDFCRYLRRNILPFHRQSQGFGLDAFLYNDYDEVFRTGMMSFPSSTSIVKHVPLPTYFKRKLFYNLTKDFRGLPTWELNQEGQRFMISRSYDSAVRLARNVDDALNNCPNKELVDSFNALLGKRTTLEFAAYVLFYKGRILDRESVTSRLVFRDDPLPALDDWIIKVYSNHSGDYLLNNDSPTTSRYYWYGKFLRLDLRDFLDNFVITESSHPSFADFDKLFDKYCSMLLPLNERKESAFQYLQHLKRRYKAMANNQPFFNSSKFIPNEKKD